jgi:hypothetical protein
VNSGLTDIFVYSLAVLDTNIFAGTWGHGVFYSTNKGSTWTAANNGLPISSVFSFAVSGPNIFAGASFGVYLSTNNGSSWTVENNALPANDVYSLAVLGTNLFAATAGGGVRKRPLSEMIAVENPIATPINSVQIGQNYPNPFNPSTSINYSIIDKQKAHLSIYSNDGTLVLKQEVQGQGIFHWNAEKEASGVYLCKLETGNKVFCNKMLLIR